MKHLKLAITMILLSVQPVWAEQLKSISITSENDDGWMHYAIDIDSIKKDGKFRMIKVISDAWAYTKYDEISWRSKEEYDCYEERVRTHEWFSFSDVGGKGKLIRTQVNSTPQWKRVRPESPNSKVLKIVCAK